MVGDVCVDFHKYNTNKSIVSILSAKSESDQSVVGETPQINDVFFLLILSDGNCPPICYTALNI